MMRESRDTSGLPPPREELPTLPIDLSDYARDLCTLPDLADEGFEDITAQIAIDSFLDVRRRHVPRVAIAPSQVADYLIDHREGFIVSLLDGVSSVEMLLDIAGMPQAEALTVL